jgi:ribosome modulation factor
MKTAKGYFDMGYSARNQGLSKEANPLLFGNGWPHEAWNLGFEFAELEANAGSVVEPVLERIPANPFEQGKNSHIRGIAFEDCPYSEGVDQVTWQAGWISQEEGDSTGLFRSIFNALKYTFIAAVIILAMWAFISATWPKASGEQSDCQRNSPPWHTAECYEKPVSP